MALAAELSLKKRTGNDLGRGAKYARGKTLVRHEDKGILLKATTLVTRSTKNAPTLQTAMCTYQKNEKLQNNHSSLKQ